MSPLWLHRIGIAVHGLRLMFRTICAGAYRKERHVQAQAVNVNVRAWEPSSSVGPNSKRVACTCSIGHEAVSACTSFVPTCSVLKHQDKTRR